MNPFEAYAKRALSPMPPRLIGPIKLREEARQRYAEITAALASCDSLKALFNYLDSIDVELIQFRAELPFLWEGDDPLNGGFLGLAREIERAQVRLDDGLDYPRHEPRTQLFEEKAGQ